MAGRDIFLVFVSGKPDHEADYARWFCGEHKADMARLPGVLSVHAGQLSALDSLASPAQLCAIYETPDCAGLLQTIAASKGTAALPVSDLQGAMVWRVLECDQADGELTDAPVVIGLFEGEPGAAGATADLLADLPLKATRVTRMGAAQSARGREYPSILLLALQSGADPAAVAATLASHVGTAAARFLLVTPVSAQ
jgi:hypothetical protein